MPDTTVVLIDYDNATITAEIRPQDTRANVAHIMNALRAVLPPLAAPKDVSVRLYGGWHFDDGRLTPRADWLRRALPDFRGREDGIRIRPELTSSVAAASGKTLLGTYRNVAKPEQKMVDSMMAVDVLHFTARHDTFVIVATNDRDITPALVASQRNRGRSTRLAWLRASSVVTPNDGLLSTSNTTVTSW